jgi:hypothetical protein
MSLRVYSIKIIIILILQVAVSGYHNIIITICIILSLV